MKNFFKKPVLVAIVSFIAVWSITAGIAYGATVFSRSMNASVKIVGEASFSFYSDQAATQVINQVSLPDVSPGETSTFTVYLKNTSSVTEVISAGSNAVPPSVGTLTLTFDGQTQKTLAPGAVCKVVGTLRVSEDADDGSIDFSFSVNAATATTGPTPTPTGTTLSGQQLFTTNCLSCHATGAPNTSRTKSQLLQFIPGHQTGSNLTAAEVAAIAAFIKP